MALTDFLSDEQGPSSGTSYVMANKMDWAAEMEEADASKHEFSYITHKYVIIGLDR